MYVSACIYSYTCKAMVMNWLMSMMDYSWSIPGCCVRVGLRHSEGKAMCGDFWLDIQNKKCAEQDLRYGIIGPLKPGIESYIFTSKILILARNMARGVKLINMLFSLVE